MATRVTQVVTFAAEPFRGNPAFVVSLERGHSVGAPPGRGGTVGRRRGRGARAAGRRCDPPALRHGHRTSSGRRPCRGGGRSRAARGTVERRCRLRGWHATSVLAGRRARRGALAAPCHLTACALGPTLGAALGRAAEHCLAARSATSPSIRSEAALRDLAPDMAALAEPRSECSDRYGPWYRIGHRGPRLRPQGRDCPRTRSAAPPIASSRRSGASASAANACTAAICRRVAAISGASSTAQRSRSQARPAAFWKGSCYSQAHSR